MTITTGITLWDVRTFIYRHFAETTSPPGVADVAQAFGFDAVTAAGYFHELDGIHALFLEPGTADIRIANPFSAVPTGFRVHALGRAYWANCAWDSLGIPAALHADAVIEASCAENGQPLVLEVAGGQVKETTAVAHFLVPFRRWYEDMTYTWATIVLFRSEEAVAEWRQAGGSTEGEVIPVPLLWELSKAWYHNRLSPDYRGRTAADVETIFAGLDLTSSFWQVGPDLTAPQK